MSKLKAFIIVECNLKKSKWQRFGSFNNIPIGGWKNHIEHGIKVEQNPIKKINIFKKWNLKKSWSFRWKGGFFFFGPLKILWTRLLAFTLKVEKSSFKWKRNKKIVFINILESFYTIILTFLSAPSLTSPRMWWKNIMYSWSIINVYSLILYEW